MPQKTKIFWQAETVIIQNMQITIMRILAFLGILILISGCTVPNTLVRWWNQPAKEYHAHVDIKVVVNGRTFDFNKAEYMDTPTHEIPSEAHMHDFNPKIMHLHNASATLGDFFGGIGLSISSRCLDTGKAEYCSDGTRNLFVYVNGQPLFPGYDNYIPKDLDRILVYYGEGVPSQKLINSVTSEACIYSKKCLSPPGFDVWKESCAGNGPCRPE